MPSLLKIRRNLYYTVGAILIFGAMSKSDYYTMVEKTTEPDYIATMFVAGVLLLAVGGVCHFLLWLKGQERG